MRQTLRRSSRSAYDIPQNLESSDVSLLVFGNGDGGGGPLAKMLENVSLNVL